MNDKKQRAAPRLRGKAFQDGSAWRWEVHITFHPDREISETEYEIVDPITLSSPKDTPYTSKEAALLAMKSEVPKMMEIMGQAMGQKIETIIDMKTGEHRPVNEA